MKKEWCLSLKMLSPRFHIGSSTIQKIEVAFPPPAGTEVLFGGNTNSSSTLCPANSSHFGLPKLRY